MPLGILRVCSKVLFQEFVLFFLFFEREGIDFAVFQNEVEFQINCMIPRFVFQHSFRGFFLKHCSVFSINFGEFDFGFVVNRFM